MVLVLRCSLLLLLLLLGGSVLAEQGANGAAPHDLMARLDGAAAGSLHAGGDIIRARVALARFYRKRDFAPAWTRGDAGPLLDELRASIEQADAHGLTPSDYHQTALLEALEQDDMVALELLATDAYLTLAAHLVGGRLHPVSIEPDWTASRRERDLVRDLEKALESGRIAASLQALEPDAPAYGVLKGALAMYRQAAKEGGWGTIIAGPALKLGDRGERVIALRQRLRMTGLLEAPETQTDEFDIALETAVAAFQRRVGLEADGVVGAATQRELNKRPADRVDLVRANLERWRWLPQDLGRRHVRVNIADYRLEARRDGLVEQVHDVIVGRTYRQTPVFSDEISYLVFNPWWETPASLARQDKLPAFRKDPASVERLGFEVIGRDGKLVDPVSINWADYSAESFPFRLRQRPGPLNALGRVKLMFPNRHNVYLHDTPSRELFARGERAFSSGCVRVADVLALTAWLLEETAGWTQAKIDAVVAAGRETRVNLASKVPVHILYFTAVTDADGSLRLISDIYGRDARLIAALDRAPPAADQ